MENVLADLSNTYCGILWLDYTKYNGKIPEDVLFIEMNKVM